MSNQVNLQQTLSFIMQPVHLICGYALTLRVITPPPLDDWRDASI